MRAARLSAALLVSAASGAQHLTCHSVSPQVSDGWCDSNCNHSPPNCPAALCKCDAPTPPTPAPPSPPTPPGPKPPSPPPGGNFKVSGPWYYIADGTATAHAFDKVPDWMYTTQNVVSLAFMDPQELPNGEASVPQVFIDAAADFKGRGQGVFFSIGGYSYAGRWGWLQDAEKSAACGRAAAAIAQKHGVGIEIDYEGGADPADGLVAFIKGFRSVCQMGDCLLTMDLYGGPGGAGWQKGTVPRVLPANGTVGEVAGDGNWLDYVNVMVIDGQPVTTALTYWQQWVDTGVLNTRRSAFSLDAGFPGLGICDGKADAGVDSAVSWLAQHGVYGVMYWAVCPPGPGAASTCGDWTADCNAAAPGFQHLCSKLGTCPKLAAPRGAAAGSARNVIYVDYKLSWSNFTTDLVAMADAGFTHINLAFWMNSAPADAVQAWQGMDAASRAAALAYVHSKGAKLLISAGGATENVQGMISSNSPTGADYGTRAAQFAMKYGLDGVDFDLELAPGDPSLFKNGKAAAWIAAASVAARKVLGAAGVISHAPQAPYFGSWAGDAAGSYVGVEKKSQGAVDFYNIQFYNQGAGLYTSYDTLFADACSGAGAGCWAAGSSVKEIAAAGVPTDKLVVGKYLKAGYASNGFVAPGDLAAMFKKARGDMGWQAGAMVWMYDTGDADVGKWAAAINSAFQG
eukprot:TRINITY_DN12379_c3_g1_i1.p1 TRINITY_DN12379_c3_g1~~TRINITY_DN12379_c3_g1_i1.p1  ORF type:complete len:711 (+),score=255.39 TRINITY_DN12379_c3_g1_i1:83-2134(+)